MAPHSIKLAASASKRWNIKNRRAATSTVAYLCIALEARISKFRTPRTNVPYPERVLAVVNGPTVTAGRIINRHEAFRALKKRASQRTAARPVKRGAY